MTSRANLEFMGVSREKMLETALGIVDRRGMDALTVKNIAEELHIRPGSFYKYFGGMDQIQDALTARCLAMLIEVLKDVTQNRSGREALEAYAVMARAFAQAHPTLYGAALRGPRGACPELDVLRQTYLGVGVRMLRGYDIPRAVAPELANCLSAALEGFITAELSGRARTKLEFDRNFERLLDILDAGAQTAGIDRHGASELPKRPVGTLQAVNG